MLKFVRWVYQDAIKHDPLRMRNDIVRFYIICLDEGPLQ
jgi:hypothetical protein